MPAETFEPEDGEGNFNPKNIFHFDAIVPVERYDILSWSPGPPQSDHPSTQVHILIHIADLEATFIMRIKSAAAMDELITALVEHQENVWPTQGIRWTPRKKRGKK